MSLANPTRTNGREATSSGARARLVTALAGVAGLSATSAAPDVATAGAAFPRWVQTTYNGALCELAVDEFDVFVVLPADYHPTTVDDGDTVRDAVAPALWAVAHIAYCEPVTIGFADNQNMPGLRFRVTVR